ncbi:hypothetical protein C8Q76DRAFT_581011, partial [Earliella scabrosa]
AFVSTADLKFGPITRIRRTGQRTKNIPWAAFQMPAEGWKRIKACADILADANRYQQICSTTHAPTLHQVIPALETLQSRWEAKRADPKYEWFHPALDKGLEKLTKYYKRLDNARAYILALYLHPYYKLTYIETRWGGEAEYLEDLANGIIDPINWQEHAKKIVEAALAEYWPKRLLQGTQDSAATPAANSSQSRASSVSQPQDDNDDDDYDRERRRRLQGAESEDGWRTEM